MPLYFEERSSDSPYIERIWRTLSGSGGEFLSIASTHWVMVVTKMHGKLTMTMRGPETQPTLVLCPPEAEHYSIVFKFGTVMPHLPASKIVDADLNLPDASSKSFWLNGAAWEFPTYDNADTFVERLARSGMLIREPIVNAALEGQTSDLSLRSVQRRFVQTTGITHGAQYQIDRAREATGLLKQGMPILDVVETLGYADQPHMTRILKQLIGQTPAQLQPTHADQQLSFLFKTQP